MRRIDKIKQKAANLTEQEIELLTKTMYRTYNFIQILEDLDIPEVNKLQDIAKENNINITSKELMETFKNILDMDIE